VVLEEVESVSVKERVVSVFLQIVADCELKKRSFPAISTE
jgi:hypothetical protein